VSCALMLAGKVSSVRGGMRGSQGDSVLRAGCGAKWLPGTQRATAHMLCTVMFSYSDGRMDIALEMMIVVAQLLWTVEMWFVDGCVQDPPCGSPSQVEIFHFHHHKTAPALRCPTDVSVLALRSY
jgi:hypothetical protein